MFISVTKVECLHLTAEYFNVAHIIRTFDTAIHGAQIGSTISLLDETHSSILPWIGRLMQKKTTSSHFRINRDLFGCLRCFCFFPHQLADGYEIEHFLRRKIIDKNWTLFKRSTDSEAKKISFENWSHSFCDRWDLSLEEGDTKHKTFNARYQIHGLLCKHLRNLIWKVRYVVWILSFSVVISFSIRSKWATFNGNGYFLMELELCWAIGFQLFNGSIFDWIFFHRKIHFFVGNWIFNSNWDFFSFFSLLLIARCILHWISGWLLHSRGKTHLNNGNLANVNREGKYFYFHESIFDCAEQTQAKYSIECVNCSIANKRCIDEDKTIRQKRKCIQQRKMSPY